MGNMRETKMCSKFGLENFLKGISLLKWMFRIT